MARVFHVQSTLKRKIKASGGMMVTEAVRRGEAILTAYAPKALAGINATLTEMERRFGRGAAQRHNEPIKDLYGLCLDIVDWSIAARDSGLPQAAQALCELVDLCVSRSVVDWEGIDLHLEAMRMLQSGALKTTKERELLLGGLKRIAAKRLDQWGKIGPG